MRRWLSSFANPHTCPPIASRLVPRLAHSLGCFTADRAYSQRHAAQSHRGGHAIVQSTVQAKLRDLTATVADIRDHADWDGIQKEIEALKVNIHVRFSRESSLYTFERVIQYEAYPQDPNVLRKARENAKRQSFLEAQLSELRVIFREHEEAQELAGMAELDASLQEEVLLELGRLQGRCDSALVKLWLSGPLDACGAYIDVRAGSGGTDACDWAAMLVRMYTKWAYSREYAGESLAFEGARLNV